MNTSIQQDVFTDELQNSAQIIFPGEGQKVQAGGGSCTFKVTSTMTGGRLGVYEIVVPPHTMGARLHYHRYMDEVFIVNKGTLSIELASETHQAAQGTTVYVPRYTPHGFSNTSNDELVLTLIFNPSEQREGYFIGLFELLQAEVMDISRFLKLAHKYDTCPMS